MCMSPHGNLQKAPRSVWSLLWLGTTENGGAVVSIVKHEDQYGYAAPNPCGSCSSSDPNSVACTDCWKARDHEGNHVFPQFRSKGGVRS